MSAKKYVTVCLRIDDDLKAKTIWDMHLTATPVMGCTITGIAHGDVMSFRDELCDMLVERVEGADEVISELEAAFYAPMMRKQ